MKKGMNRRTYAYGVVSRWHETVCRISYKDYVNV